MADRLSANLFVRELARGHRVMLLGGLAVIAHGLERKTKDVDIWLEPMSDPELWTAGIVETLRRMDAGRFWSFQRKSFLLPDEATADVAATGVVRITGFDRDIDVFRKPNEMSTADFERVWSFGGELEDGVRLPHEADVLVTKLNTGRDRDEADLRFLEAKVRRRFAERLPTCEAEEAKQLLERFIDPIVLEAALLNPRLEVRTHAASLLEQFAAEGDPYSRDILERWREKLDASE